MNNETKIKAYASHQDLLKVLASLDAIKECPSEDVKEWGEALKANIDVKIKAILKWQEENKSLLEVQRIANEALSSFFNLK